jgi:hypothetical protein
MDEIAEAIGQLRAAVMTLQTRLGEMHAENGIVVREIQRVLAADVTEIKDQMHEIKHAQNDAAQKVLVVDQQLLAHRASDDRMHQLLENGQKELQVEVIANRVMASERFDELFSWRNKIYGVVALVVFIVTIFGQGAWETVIHWWHK